MNDNSSQYAADIGDTDESAAIGMLMTLGFPSDVAHEALRICGGPQHVDRAADYLFSGGGGNSSTSSAYAPTASSSSSSSSRAATSTSSHTRIIHAPFSQYTIGDSMGGVGTNGRSACTCMALCLANAFLSRLQQQKHHQQQQIAELEIVNSDFLVQGMMAGIQLYQQTITAVAQGMMKGMPFHQQQSTGASSSSIVEHLSVEDVLTWIHSSSSTSTTSTSSSSSISTKSLQINPSIGILQGLLTTDSSISSSISIPSLYDLLHTCCSTSQQQEGGSSYTYTCVVMTKTPETILLCLPTITTTSYSNDVQSSSPYYILIDTHPRPNIQFPIIIPSSFNRSSSSPQEGYALLHTSLEDLIHSIQLIFPIMDMTNNNDSDQYDLLSSMYNAFDLYPLIYSPK